MGLRKCLGLVGRVCALRPAMGLIGAQAGGMLCTLAQLENKLVADAGGRRG